VSWRVLVSLPAAVVFLVVAAVLMVLVLVAAPWVLVLLRLEPFLRGVAWDLRLLHGRGEGGTAGVASGGGRSVEVSGRRVLGRLGS
jgi:hypothetical protein